jgi:hypothetical protein
MKVLEDYEIECQAVQWAGSGGCRVLRYCLFIEFMSIMSASVTDCHKVHKGLCRYSV